MSAAVQAPAHGGSASSPLTPAPAEVHVWRRWLDVGAAGAMALKAVLSPDEEARAARFRFERDANRFIVARATLRRVLGRCLGVEPEELAFYYGAHGKPALASPPTRLTFNLSHSGDLALLAVAWDRAIGIDVEQRRPVSDLGALAAQVFATAERAELATLPPGAREDAFLAGWTRKEAFIKAVGEGLTHPLDAFVVSLDPVAPARLLSVGGSADAAGAWSLHALTPAPGYVAALVAQGAVERPTCRTWMD